jgi:GDSL-like Lipase/Acylhydrolase family
MRKLRYAVRIIALNVLVTAVLLVVALLCIEGYLHATIPESSGESIFESTLTTRRYKVMKGNIQIVVYGSEFGTNGLGFRDNKPELAHKRSSAFRIIVLGDSFTASAGVDFERIYTSLLERNLRQMAPDVEVVNLAVGGYNPIQYELVLDEVGLSLEPDLVVVAVFPFNDLSNDTYRANYEEAMGRSRPSVTPWYQSLYVYRAFLGRLEGRIRSWFPASGASSQTPAPVDHRKRDADENLAAVERIVDKATAADIGIVVALLPNTDVFEDQRRDFAPFEALCKARQWNCLNLLDRFMASGERPASLRLNLLDPHPNDRYNALVAGFMSNELIGAIRTERARVTTHER